MIEKAVEPQSAISGSSMVTKLGSSPLLQQIDPSNMIGRLAIRATPIVRISVDPLLPLMLPFAASRLSQVPWSE